MKHRFTNTACILSILVALGCRSHGSVTITGPGAVGTLRGSVSEVVDSLGRSLGRAGVGVFLDGTQVGTTTNSGAWYLEEVPTGTYTLRLAVPGFPEQPTQQIAVVGGVTNDVGAQIAVLAPPAFTPWLALVSAPTPQRNGSVVGSFSAGAPAGVSIGLLVLRSHHLHPDISDSTSYDTTYTVSLNPLLAGDTSRIFSYSVNYTGSTFGAARVGDTIALRVYPYFRLNRTTDASGHSRWFGYGPGSNVLSAIKP